MERLWENMTRDVATRDGIVDVSGCEVRYRRAGAAGLPPLLLVHGGGAHGGWWAPVVADLALRFDVLVPDLSGYGDSGHRTDYGPQTWVDDLAAVVGACDVGPLTVVGHSMGGKVSVFLAARRPDLVRTLVLADSALRPPGPGAGAPRGRPRVPKRVYATRQEAVERFRLRPPETSADPHLLRALAEASVTKVPGGWTWKFDAAAGQRITDAAVAEALPEVRCPVGIVFGDRSTIVGSHTVDYVSELLGRHVPALAVPEAYHHLPLDAPDAFRSAVETMVRTLDDAGCASGSP